MNENSHIPTTHYILSFHGMDTITLHVFFILNPPIYYYFLYDFMKFAFLYKGGGTSQPVTRGILYTYALIEKMLIRFVTLLPFLFQVFHVQGVKQYIIFQVSQGIFRYTHISIQNIKNIFFWGGGGGCYTHISIRNIKIAIANLDYIRKHPFWGHFDTFYFAKKSKQEFS